ncbi:MAG TPA: MerR family transcriptional regulator [Rubricoccaceae bacterium]|nr:MerR family transcriptional regulator [Rubricoccaceae bacterium]
MTDSTALRVGELARRTGLTARTLHHYDAIGLLRPSARTAAGHRRYTAVDVVRLQQIASLRALGLPLDAIAALLDAPDADPRAVIERHLAHVRGSIKQQQHLVERLEALAAFHRDHVAVSTDDLLQTIHLTTMFEKHYTPEQLEQLRQRRKTVGEDRIQQVQQEWQALFAEAQRHMETGTDPAAPEPQALAAKAEALIGEFTGGDTSIRQSLNDAYAENPGGMHRLWGVSPELADYYGRIMAAYHARR